ncbi:MAG: hypothetical protein WBD67_07170 [Terracidiphilus sp.]
MKRNLYLTATLAAGAFLIFATMAAAKSKPASKSAAPPKAAAAQSSIQKDHHGQTPGIAVDHAGGNTPKAKPKSGENPLFESKDKTAVKNKPAAKNGAASPAVEYKDPEDMTTRYRPGNNKTKAASKKTKKGSAAASHQ